ncbi:MAG: prepilin peptidase [Gammaproteobacteria bacterium TMED92]|nr:MAG: prepilin peptidase [Gammaproteobacteria bacterium TMED92]
MLMFFESLLAYQWLGIVLLGCVAASVGSFINVVAHRLPIMLRHQWSTEHQQAHELGKTAIYRDPFNLATPRSHCPKCGTQIRVLDNVPLLSWLWLGGRCRQCREPISLRYPMVELCALLLGFAVVGVYGYSAHSAFYCGLAWALLALLLIDYDTGLLPDPITQPLLWAGLITNLVFPLIPLSDAVLGAIFGYTSLWLVFWSFKLLTGKEGMGYGDFKLLAALGAWLGWQALPQILMIAAVSGLLYALIRVALGKQSFSNAIPFGPFLAFAGWFGLLFHDRLQSVVLL